MGIQITLLHFKKGQYYRHMSSLDVDYYLVEILGFEADRIELALAPFHRWDHFYYAPEIVSLRREDLWKWCQVEYEPSGESF